MTCSISGLGIAGGTPVRCLLLIASPYSNVDPRRAWLEHTPPSRAIYNSYGTIEGVHKDDKFIDNSVHDVPVTLAEVTRGEAA